MKLNEIATEPAQRIYNELLQIKKPTKHAISSAVYSAITSRENGVKQVLDNPEWRSKSKIAYQKLTSGLETHAKSLGFTVADNPAWLQFNSKNQIKSSADDKVNYKIYLSFNPQKFWENYQKLGKLLSSLASLPVSFKIAGTFSGAWSHTDNVVIHFKKDAPIDQIKTAISSCQFDLQDRSTVHGRTDVGVDRDGKSHSELIADKLSNWLETNWDKLHSKKDVFLQVIRDYLKQNSQSL